MHQSIQACMSQQEAGYRHTDKQKLRSDKAISQGTGPGYKADEEVQQECCIALQEASGLDWE